MSDLSTEVKATLKPGRGLTVILTVGNTLRRDDGVGPYISKKLVEGSSLKIIACETRPENFLEEVVRLKPGQIFVIDAADFGGLAGEVKIIPNEKIPEVSLSTHAISLRLIARILEEDAGCPVKFLGIQPATVVYKEGLSGSVKKSAWVLIEHINKKFHHA